MTPSSRLKTNFRNDKEIILILVLYSTLCAYFTVYAPTKIYVSFLFIIGACVVYLTSTPLVIISFMMLLITFPVTVKIMGKEPLSSGSLIVLMTFMWSFYKSKITDTIKSDLTISVTLLIILVGPIVGAIIHIPVGHWGHTLRLYLNFLTSIIGFLVIIHISNIQPYKNSKNQYLEKIILILLLITAMHILISLLLFYFPDARQYFSIFLSGREQELGARNLYHGAYTRATTTFTGGEEFGELLILLFPFILYKTFTARNYRYNLLLMIFVLGVFLSATRSSFLIIGLQSLCFLFIVLGSKRYKTKIIKLIIISLIILFFTAPLYLHYSKILFDRLNETIYLYQSQANIISVINRQKTWPEAFNITIKTLSLFGHGTIKAYNLGYRVGNFHSLYMTLLFQFGVVGTFTFLYFFFLLSKRMITKLRNNEIRHTQAYYLITACLLSLFGFLVNEVKFEFNRMDAYQKVVWLIFSVYYLSCASKSECAKHE